MSQPLREPHRARCCSHFACRPPLQLLTERGIDTAILVTSALHMPRARKHFEAAGLNITPAPADFEVADIYTDWQDLLPDTRALDGSTRAFKELAGHWLSR